MKTENLAKLIKNVKYLQLAVPVNNILLFLKIE